MGDPSIFDARPLNGSHVRGTIMASLGCAEYSASRCQRSGTNIELQVQSLHDAAAYAGLVQDGPCGAKSRILQHFQLAALEDRSEGIVGSTVLAVPIHYGESAFRK